MLSADINQLIEQMSTTHQGDVEVWEKFALAIKKDEVDCQEVADSLTASGMDLNRSYQSVYRNDNIENINNYTFLTWTIAQGQVKVGEVLLKAEAHGNTRQLYSLAIASERLEVVKLLLDYGVKPNIFALWELDPISQGELVNGRADIANLLLTHENGIDIPQTDAGRKALMVAAAVDTSTVAILLAKGVNIDIQNWEGNGNTALMEVALAGSTAGVEALLTNGADINIRSQRGDTALMMAAQEGHTDIVKTFLTNGADINNRNQGGITALMMAAHGGHTDTVKTLLTNGADINNRGQRDNTALMMAAQEGHTDIVKTLIEEGAVINIQAKDGKTALMMAAQRGHRDIVEALLTNGADINITDQSGNTALHYAVSGVRPILEVVTMLLDQGADMLARNKDQQTPRDLAATRNPIIMSVFNNFQEKVRGGVADNLIRNDPEEIKERDARSKSSPRDTSHVAQAGRPKRPSPTPSISPKPGGRGV
ncbi:ankyrin repeat domain-containing protein [Candidatus Tisiphia endosymbiont of Beris chalybata]|uniref:ankyrin repeat domain-containing protein n=1 Tax=Candidatus Tisiphia endosymbiont of Beris chalybata TaxID=3066262 RepID=UPI00312CB7EF